MVVIRWDKDDAMEMVRDQFDRGWPVVVPTDTLYGLCGPISEFAVVGEIFRLKRRPIDITLPVAVGDIDSIKRVAAIDEATMKVLAKELPGPYTYILPAAADLPSSLVRDGTVAVRVPHHPIFGRICGRFGPIALTSANVHGSPDIVTAAGVDVQFDREVLVLKDDRSIRGCASTIIDLTKNERRVIRRG